MSAPLRLHELATACRTGAAGAVRLRHERARQYRLRRPSRRAEAIETAARTACLHDDIAALPQGYATLLGERGVTISGGQRQRLAIARALLLDAPVLVLDDCLSSVDAGTEALLLRNLTLARRDAHHGRDQPSGAYHQRCRSNHCPRSGPGGRGGSA
jgi:ATPase subunit of ABC transporter with duplicated ATPase domains